MRPERLRELSGIDTIDGGLRSRHFVSEVVDGGIFDRVTMGAVLTIVVGALWREVLDRRGQGPKPPTNNNEKGSSRKTG